jgi:transcriptional regulator with GAF, ATPase, and Fis domain
MSEPNETAEPSSEREAGTLRERTTLRKSSAGPASRLGPRPELRVVHSPDTAAVGTSVALREDIVVIGRNVGGDAISVRDPEASRLHLRVSWDARTGCHRVGDADSTNGTFLNGRTVKTAPLRNGDVLRFGDTLLVYQESNAMGLLRARAAQSAPSGLSTLILGETGTGKEVLAREIHTASGRSGALVPINCAGLRPELIAAELFGHTKGAFSGAANARPGVFVAAEGGTLFLDEVGELPLDVQAILLRAVQEHRIRPVGSDREVAVDVRVIAATNVELDVAAKEGKFRKDLYARLAELSFCLPPLRERRASILSLLSDSAESLVITADAAEALLLWGWPHNIRELLALGRSFAALNTSARPLDIEDLAEMNAEMVDLVRSREQSPRELGSNDKPPPVDRAKLQRLLAAHGGNVSAVAKSLDVDRTQVYRWMKYLGLAAEEFR